MDFESWFMVSLMLGILVLIGSAFREKIHKEFLLPMTKEHKP